ncbi:DUF6557 family protein [Dethiobacter alkaliphilus]|uniref:Uncharacterized protein n=1 Tax=Dethiobacter alkaliphilus AHT 1 TaxID=555088 RepID=C0GGM7_DETAL|nr:DUF6557 family protein [Dethiobacter alkaliphilus]EEG77468.1 hypothetical protein DealDRAFT_1591 [Dethiobacter alkaliphilus AHT 1]
MLFKELLNTVDYEDVWKILDSEYCHEEGAYEIYKHVIEELKSLLAKPSEQPTTLVVAKIKNILEPNGVIFDVFGVFEDDKERYSLSMEPWEEWNGFNVLDKSIQIYGAPAVVAHAIYELTFYGYSAEGAAKRVAKEKQILKRRLDEIERGETELIPYEEVRADLGIADNRTPEEKEQQKKQMEKAHAENQEVYKMLLGWV